jgi:hypothetical protein
LDFRPLPPPLEHPMLDEFGIVTEPWANFFNIIYRYEQYINPTYLTADSITLTVGDTTDAIADLQTELDGNIYEIQEEAGVPGIHLEVAFADVYSIKAIDIRLKYDGSLTHSIRIQLYNYSTTVWDEFDSLSDTLGYVHHEVVVKDDTNYISGKAVIVRLYHPESGNASHDLHVDHVGLLA